MRTSKISLHLMAAIGLVILPLLGISICSTLSHDLSVAYRDEVLAPGEEAQKKEIESIAWLVDFYAKSVTQLNALLRTAIQASPEVEPVVQALNDIEARTVASDAKVVALMKAGDALMQGPCSEPKLSRSRNIGWHPSAQHVTRT